MIYLIAAIIAIILILVFIHLMDRQKPQKKFKRQIDNLFKEVNNLEKLPKDKREKEAARLEKEIIEIQTRQNQEAKEDKAISGAVTLAKTRQESSKPNVTPVRQINGQWVTNVNAVNYPFLSRTKRRHYNKTIKKSIQKGLSFDSKEFQVYLKSKDVNL